MYYLLEVLQRILLVIILVFIEILILISYQAFFRGFLGVFGQVLYLLGYFLVSDCQAILFFRTEIYSNFDKICYQYIQIQEMPAHKKFQVLYSFFL